MTYPIIIERWNETPERQAELDLALRDNLSNPLIDTVVLLCQPGCNIPVHEKVKHVELDGRIKFNATISIVNNLLPGRVCILTNADIVFDETLSLLDGTDWNIHAACLTRWFEWDNDWHPFYVKGSFDTWIFQSPLDISGNTDDFSMGEAGCDARVTYELLRAGKKLINPAWSVVTKHYHWCDKRNYLKLHMNGLYALALPHRLGEETQVFTYDYKGDGVYPPFVYGTCAPWGPGRELVKRPAKPRS